MVINNITQRCSQNNNNSEKAKDRTQSLLHYNSKMNADFSSENKSVCTYHVTNYARVVGEHAYMMHAN